MKKKRALNVKQLGAMGDGVADDTAAIQAALDDASWVVVPPGDYRITATLKVPSNTQLTASPLSRFFLCGETPKKRGDFLLSNSDPAGGNDSISISGGVWDGNNTGRCNVKADLFDFNGYSGTVLNFCGVRGLTLKDITVSNPPSYYIRLCRLDKFEITNVKFQSAERRTNQDGLNFGGEVRNGRISDIIAVTPGQTNDDLIAFNADDCLTRVENFDLSRGPIENVTVENISAENCYTFFRFLSVTAPIRNIKVKNVRGGCRAYALNIDSARHCRTPLFKEDEFPEGAGRIENVKIEDMCVWHRGDLRELALIVCESQLKNFRIRNFSRPIELDSNMEMSTLLVRYVTGTTVHITGKNGETSFALNRKSDILGLTYDITDISIN